MNNASTHVSRTPSAKMALGLTSREFAIIAMLVALQILLGIWSIPMPAGLSITFNMIPMAIAAIVLGWKGGAITGGVFGLISFLQAFGLLNGSPMGVALIGQGASPVLMFVHRFCSRLLDGLILGFAFRPQRKRLGAPTACSVTGFLAAFLNTLLFMSTLVWFFSGTVYMQEKMAGKAFFAYIVSAVGVNGLIEMAVSTVLTGAVGTALYRAGYIKE